MSREKEKVVKGDSNCKGRRLRDRKFLEDPRKIIREKKIIGKSYFELRNPKDEANAKKKKKWRRLSQGEPI